MKNKTTKTFFSYTKIREIFADKQFSNAEKVFIIYLLICDGTEGIFPTQKTIAAHLNFSPRYVNSLLNSLKVKGYVEWKRRGFNKSNIYTMNPELYFTYQDTDMKSSSHELRITDQYKNRTVLQHKDTNSKDTQNNSVVHNKFREISKEPLDPHTTQRLDHLIKEVGEQNVLDAIQVAAKRRLKFLRIGLIESILKDYSNYGKPNVRPTYTPCGSCSEGYIAIDNYSVKVCRCLIEFEDRLHTWKHNPYSK